MTGLLLYSRPGCHLCEKMKAQIDAVAASLPAAAPGRVTEIDISADPALERRYGLHIPVLVKDGKELARGRISDEDLRNLLGRATSR